MKRTLDWEDLIKRLGDEELIKEVVPEFLSNNIDYLEALTKAIEMDEASKVQITAHSLKGAAASISATPLSEAAGELELLAKDLSLDDATVTLNKLREEYNDLIELLNNPDWVNIAKQAGKQG